MNKPTEAKIAWAIKTMRQAHAGGNTCMADIAKAERILKAMEAAK